MAKENYALMIGLIEGSPIVDRAKGMAKYVIKTIRRNDRIDYPIINVLNEALLDSVETFKEGDYIMVKGFIATQEVKKGVVCPHCQTILKTEGTTTEVIAIDNIRLELKYDLEEIKEFSNTVMVLGSLCRDVEFRLLPNTSTALAQYQLAVNRKFNVKREGSSFTDYPWISTFGKQAEQDAMRLETGSQVFIHGGLQTRNVYKTMLCESCDNEFKAEDFVSEIVPYWVEYLNNCKFD